MAYVYMVKNDKDELYVGVSENPNSRLKEHNTQRGSVFTKLGNFRIVFQEKYPTLSEARRREIQIKNWRRDKKEMLINRQNQGLPTKA
jgi:putative endonuclease